MSESARACARSLLFYFAALLLPTVAHADTPPSLWDRAKDPGVADAYRIHLEVQRRLSAQERFETSDAQLRTVRSILERYNAAKSKDPLLRFDLGYVYLKLNEHQKAAQTLTSALAEYPDHPAAEDGWLRLAFACGHMGDHECERRSYLKVLEYVTEEIARATPSLNLAETDMHLGNMRDAIEGYRETLRIAARLPAGRETAPLAVWGLAVALDRSGDPLGAEKEARRARELSQSIGLPHLLRSDGVFFVPAYEVTWYEGLGSSAMAKVATSPSEALRHWRAAEASFTAYVRGAQAAGKDRWLEQAKLRLANAKAEREKAEKKQLNAPRRPVVLDDEETTL